ncbi:MAG: M15 family metallopeptidase [Leptolyngbyaceae cyanobacterium SM1_1_3]|nr:M15 family metallopeptidase [Leptolyngbyaceae cyanobacterium SM1_1_3]NJN04031.1 M15 family metallopeptidase [Leptolyngbyaceae cyanobacterium RM1_1_2]NJO09777.1 M15 family metallopeptidase [Leptolyngbyaceae cyanobacterium SL_1_1]
MNIEEPAEPARCPKEAARCRPLRNYAASGFLNLPKDLVEAMTGAGLEWGGDWKGAKDFMHFELP